MRFQVLFHSPPGVLFTFPSRYCFTIGSYHVFSLGRWSSRIPAGFLVSHGTQVARRRAHRISCTGLSPPLVALPSSLPLYDEFLTPLSRFAPAQKQTPTTPAPQRCKPWHDTGLGSSLFARRYSGNLFIDFFSSRYLDGSVPWVSLPHPMYSDVSIQPPAVWVTPFGYPRILRCLLLPADYRSLPRPSSPDSS